MCDDDYEKRARGTRNGEWEKMEKRDKVGDC